MKASLLFLVIFLWCFVPTTQIKAGGCNESAFSFPPAGSIAEITPGKSNNMRAEPNPNAELIAVIPPAQPFLVGDSLVIDSNYFWIELTYNSARGWTVAANCETGEVYVISSSQTIATNSEPIVPWGTSTHRDVLVEHQGERLLSPIQAHLPLSFAADTIMATYSTAGDRRDPNTGYGYPSRLRISADDFSWLITIYPAAMFEVYYPGRITALQEILATRPIGGDESNYNFHPEAAVRLVHAREQYMDFAWGRGYRVIEFFTNGSYPVPPSMYQYRFYGLSHDNRYFVFAQADIFITPPQAVYDAFRNEAWQYSELDLERANYYSADSWRAWLIMEDHIANAAEDAFSPHLTSLNDWLGSFQIPSDILPEEAFNTPAEYAERSNHSQQNLSPSPQPNLCGAAYGSSLQVGSNAWQILENDPVRVRTEASGDYAGFDIPPYEVVAVIAGPICAEVDGQAGVWWQIETVDGQSGWVVEGLGERLFFRHHW